MKTKNADATAAEKSFRETTYSNTTAAYNQTTEPKPSQFHFPHSHSTVSNSGVSSRSNWCQFHRSQLTIKNHVGLTLESSTVAVSFTTKGSWKRNSTLRLIDLFPKFENKLTIWSSILSRSQTSTSHQWVVPNRNRIALPSVDMVICGDELKDRCVWTNGND